MSEHIQTKITNGLVYCEQDRELFGLLWQKFVAEYKLGPYYLLTFIDYLLAYAGDKLKADKSFVYVKNYEPVAIVFLPLEEFENTRSISIWSYFCPAPYFLPQAGLESKIMAIIDKLAAKEKIDKIMLHLDALENEVYPYNYLLDHGYLNASFNGYLIDCGEPAMRRNHERAVKKIQSDKKFSLFIMNKDNASFEIHEIYRELHHKCAGKITRPKETFDLQYQLLTEGHSILVGLKYEDKFVAFTYYTYASGKAIAFSAADDPDFAYLPLYHIINWQALKELNKFGVKFMDVGQPLNLSPQLFYSVDNKQKNISLFKTGFAGQKVNYFQSVKYYTRSSFERDIQNFIDTYQVAAYE